MEELLEVVKVHLSRYENTAKTYKSSPTQVNPSDLNVCQDNLEPCICSLK